MAGLPDDTMHPSVVRCFKEQRVIKKPSRITGSGWDCYIISLPIGSPVAFDNIEFTLNNAGVGSFIKGYDADFKGTFGTITVVCVPAGSPWYGDAFSASSADYWSDNYSVNVGLADPGVPSRIIAGGYEIVNSTPDIYKGGTVTTADVTSHWQETYLNWARQLSASTIGTGFIQYQRAPPSNAGDLARLPNAKTWAAAEGAYARLPIDVNNSSYMIPARGSLIGFYCGEGKRSLVSDFSVDLTVKAAKSITVPTVPVRSNIGVSITAFTGLTDQTTLTLSSMIFVETAPQLDMSEIALATPTADYDPKVLALYKNLHANLPTAVPVGMNPKGEWWAMVLDQLGTVIKGSSTMLSGVPTYGPLLAAGAGAVGAGISHIGAQLKSQRKPSPNPPAQRPLKEPKPEKNVKAKKKEEIRRQVSRR